MEESIKHDNIKAIIENLPRVKNIGSSRWNCGERVIANQFIIEGKGFTLFQSYKSPIALRTEGKVYIFKDWDYSVTTGKYRNLFLGETKSQTLARLKSGEYIAIDFEVKP